MISHFRQIITVCWKLGVMNILRFLVYQFKIKSGYIRACTHVSNSAAGTLFVPASGTLNLCDPLAANLVDDAEHLLAGLYPKFSGHLKSVGSPPQWFQLGEKNSDSHWTKVSINTHVNNDVKVTWDLSRFQWAQTFAAAYTITNEPKYLEALNAWVADWWNHNPTNAGVNWVCAQEVGIRMLHLLNSAYLLEQYQRPSSVLVRFVQVHCERIIPTLQYSIAQANNHGIVEAVALFVGGNWLNKVSQTDAKKAQGHRYARKGAQVLEKLLGDLVSSDGSFSMYSLNYHRVVLDALSLAEFWRRTLTIKPFSKAFYVRASSMVDYLFSFVDEESGDVPNIGANDGSRPFLLTDSDYRDYRPSVQIGACLFQESFKFSIDECKDTFAFMGWDSKFSVNTDNQKSSHLFKDSGFAVLTPRLFESSWATISFPNYKFRPSHSDPLHFDLWDQGRNILCDSGTYSYNTDGITEGYYSGSHGHNVIQFDGREAMPKISRFLVADWLSTSAFSPIEEWLENSKWQASYRDKKGAEHCRSIHYKDKVWVVTDKIRGHKEKAVLRWHLIALDWNLNDRELLAEHIKIVVKASAPILRFELLSGNRSLIYSVSEETPMLEVEVGCGQIVIITEIHLG